MSYREYQKRKWISRLLIAALSIALFFVICDSMNHFNLTATYKGNGTFITEDGNEWKIDLSSPIPVGMEVTLNMYLPEGAPYESTEVRSIELPIADKLETEVTK